MHKTLKGSKINYPSYASEKQLTLVRNPERFLCFFFAQMHKMSVKYYVL